MRFLKLIKHLLFFTFLTLLTQVGGLIWLISVFVAKLLKKKKRIIFPVLYLLMNLVIVPPIASFYGRKPLPIFDKELKPRNWFYPLTFRNYVAPILKDELKNSADTLYLSGISITYLDANFPFFDGFPLLPHLSHNDGKKIDISFMYLDENGEPTNKKPSVSGYGAYSNSENNSTSKKCEEKGYWQYSFSKYLTFGKLNHLKLDKQNTRQLILELLSNRETQKIFIEPHLKTFLNLSNESKIRFHGCQAVRHDDHIHLQTK